MKMHITGLEKIVAKKSGVEWLKISAVSSETGEVLETMIEAGKVPNKDDIEKAVIGKDELKEAFGAFEPVEVSFDKRGRLDSITA